MKYRMKDVPYVFGVILLLILTAFLLFASLAAGESNFVAAHATEIKVMDEAGDEVDVNRLHDALLEMYGLRIYSAKTDIPHYFQNDYKDVAFASDTIETSGCGITCLSMIVEYLLDEKIMPDEMAERYSCGSNAAAAMELGIRSLGLNCRKYYDNTMYEHFRDAVEDGHPVIVLMKAGSPFTTVGHFMVVAGKTEDGKYIINDPNRENYEKTELIYGYKNGFTEREVFKGLVGVYIFDKKETEHAPKSVLSVYRDVIKEIGG